MEFNYWGLGVWILNLVLFFMLKETRRIGHQRSAGISGWISVLFGLLILTIQKVPPFYSFSSPLLIIIAIIVVFAILFIYMPALSPNINLGSMGNICSLSMKVGWFIGIVMGLFIALFT